MDEVALSPDFASSSFDLKNLPWPCRAPEKLDTFRAAQHHEAVRFSIVTPSYRSSSWLRLCIASVSDQHVDLEHIVQDAGSDDGTLDWLLTDKRVRPFVEKDRGMYDALNRGFDRSNGDVLAWLNCDEQYLEGRFRRSSHGLRHTLKVRCSSGYRHDGPAR
jgi:hypothetical protein